MIKKIYQTLSTPEEDGKRIGLFRIVCSIFGGFILSYLAMTLLVFLIPDKIPEAALFSIMYNTIVWAALALWISLSHTKLIALLRVIIPTVICSILLLILY